MPHSQIEQYPDENDRASALEMMNTEMSLLDVRKSIKRSQEALPDGSYAIEDCISCGNEIGIGRLTHAIKNTICIDCANALERRR